MRKHLLSITIILTTALSFGCVSEHAKKSEEQIAADQAAAKPLYDRLGGKPAVDAIVSDFVSRAATDPKVNFTRQGIPGAQWDATPDNVAHLKSELSDYLTAATGGPVVYKGKKMKQAHANMQITNAEFDAIAGDLKASLDKFKVPAKEQGELLTLVDATRKDVVTK
jgi:hemoglobin